MPRELKIGQKYRHYKGNEYLVVDVAKNTETEEIMVVYKQLYGNGGLWVRPLDMFLESIERDGKIINRFEEMEED